MSGREWERVGERVGEKVGESGEESGREWERSKAMGNLLVYLYKYLGFCCSGSQATKDFAIIWICCVKKCAD